MIRDTAFVSLFGESENEAKNYLLYNTEDLEVRFLSVAKDGFYLFEVLGTEKDFSNLEELNDVRVYYKK